MVAYILRVPDTAVAKKVLDDLGISHEAGDGEGRNAYFEFEGIPNFPPEHVKRMKDDKQWPPPGMPAGAVERADSAKNYTGRAAPAGAAAPDQIMLKPDPKKSERTK